jgi:hypothetical protein
MRGRDLLWLNQATAKGSTDELPDRFRSSGLIRLLTYPGIERCELIRQHPHANERASGRWPTSFSVNWYCRHTK